MSDDVPVLSKNQYKAMAYAFNCQLDITPRDAELLRAVHEKGGIRHEHGKVTSLECPIDKKEFNRLKREGWTENKGFGFTVSLSGRIQLMIFDGIDPWYGGPTLSYEKAIEKGIIKAPCQQPLNTTDAPIG